MTKLNCRYVSLIIDHINRAEVHMRVNPLYPLSPGQGDPPPDPLQTPTSASFAQIPSPRRKQSTTGSEL